MGEGDGGYHYESIYSFDLELALVAQTASRFATRERMQDEANCLWDQPDGKSRSLGADLEHDLLIEPSRDAKKNQTRSA
jgi:hypothetical protein